MAYQVLLGGVLFPVAPQKIDVKISSGNETVKLIDGAEMNILKTPELSDISFSVELPGTRGRSYAVYENGFQPPGYFLDKLKHLKLSSKSALFQVARVLPDGSSLHKTAMEVSIEDYTITDDAKEGLDTVVKLELRQYTQKETHTGSLIATLDGGTAVTVQKQRAVSMSAPMMQATVATALVGDTLWSIAKRYLGDGAKHTTLTALNGISNSGVTAGQSIKLR